MGNAAQVRALTREEMKNYLQQYRTGAERRHILEERRRNIIGELRAAHNEYISGPDPIIDEIEARIVAQQKNTEIGMLRALELMKLLPSGSVERMVVELRHIHGLSWKEIAAELFLARSNVFSHYNAALDMLIKHERTMELIRDIPL